MTTFTFKINTVAKSIHDFTVKETRMGSLEIRVPYATSVSVGDSFEILENATTLLKGSIYRIKAERMGPRQRKILTCLGKTRVLYEKFCLDYGYNDYLSKDVGWIANDLVDHYFSGILTSVNVDTTTGVTSTHFNCDGMSVGAALEELARRGDCFFYVDDSDDVHFYVAGAESSGETVQGSSLKRIIVTDESARHINKVIVRGRHKAIQATAGSSYPERYFQDSRITSIAEAQEVANALLAELNKDRKEADIILPSFLNVRGGTTLIFNSPTDGYTNSTEKIQRVQWAFSTTRSRTTITIGDEQPTIDSVLAALARGANWNIDSQEVAEGTSFPTNPVDGDLFKLTTDITGYLAATYQYSSASVDWLRGPIILRRSSDPPSGTEVEGDILERSDEGKLYQWTGAAWELIGASDLGSFTGDLDDVTDGALYGRVYATYLDASRALVKDLNQITAEIITIGKIRDWTIGVSAPGAPNTGHIWLDTSESPPQQKRWDGASWVRMDVITLIDMSGDLDDITNGTTYGKVLITSISAGKIILAQVEGDLDDVTEGTSYGKVLLTSLQAGEILLSESVGDIDDILDGTTYGKVKLTSLQSGAILLAEGIGDLDDITEGTIYGKVKLTSLQAGEILLAEGIGTLDDILEGTTYGKVRLTNISAGNILLVTDQNLGDQGIKIISNTGTTRIELDTTEIAGYNVGVKQFYLSAADGKAYAAGGTVVLDADGITVREQDFLLKDSGGTLRGRVSFYGTMNGWPLESVILEGINTKGAALYAGGAYVWVAQAGDVSIRAPSGKEIKLYGDEVTANLDVNPNVSGQHDLGKPARKWDEIHADDIYGTVRYSDMHFLDRACPSCGEPFKVGESLILRVTGFEVDDITGREMLAVPHHNICPNQILHV